MFEAGIISLRQGHMDIIWGWESEIREAGVQMMVIGDGIQPTPHISISSNALVHI